MKNSLVVGLTVTKQIEIDKSRTISFMGNEGRVYSTPAMVEDIEYTCHELLDEHLDENENSVGIHISVDHIGASLESDTIDVSVTVIKIEGRVIEMEAAVNDSIEQVGKGIHRRFLVDTNKTYERIKLKREQIEQLKNT